MAIVTTIPNKGMSPQAYDIPDADLQKYAKANTQFVEGEDPVAGATNVQEADAIGLSESDDVEAYGHRCYCWYWIGDRYIKRQAPCWWRRCP